MKRDGPSLERTARAVVRYTTVMVLAYRWSVEAADVALASLRSFAVEKSQQAGNGSESVPPQHHSTPSRKSLVRRADWRIIRRDVNADGDPSGIFSRSRLASGEILASSDVEQVPPKTRHVKKTTYSGKTQEARNRISFDNHRILVAGNPFHIKGVNWNPVRRGGSFPADLDYSGFVEKDSRLMAAAGVNVVRTYAPITKVAVLDVLWAQGISVVNPVLTRGDAADRSVVEIVKTVRDHPAIMMWAIGNEWNFNGLNAKLEHAETVEKINALATLIKENDVNHPVCTIYGGLPSEDTIEAMPDIDVWGINVFSGDTFGNLFKLWKARSGMKKPMFVGEYGADAYNSLIGREDQKAQAEAVAALTSEISSQSAGSKGNVGGVCIGGFVFEFADEWWRDGRGKPGRHDTLGFTASVGSGHKSGPHPDGTFNQEWWGLVDVARKPRLAYDAFKASPNPVSDLQVQGHFSAHEGEGSIAESETATEMRLTCGDSCPHISISGRQLLINGDPLHIKGLNWSPTAKSGTYPKNLQFRNFVDQDADLMRSAGVNVVRTYEPLTDTYVLDALLKRGIWVANTVYSYGRLQPQTVVDVVKKVKNHPAMLMWIIGNEWNYNGLYSLLNESTARDRVNKIAGLVKRYDKRHPVSTVYGGCPSARTIMRMPNIDLWGVNIFSGISFGRLFETWKTRSKKPMYLGEYGADAFNALTGKVDEKAQADATAKLTHEILSQSAVKSGGVCLGGLLFELADEWWKVWKGSSSWHDTNGLEAGGGAPGAGPYPDNTFNEEWWGIVDADRKPRMAFNVFKSIKIPSTISPIAQLVPAAKAKIVSGQKRKKLHRETKEKHIPTTTDTETRESDTKLPDLPGLPGEQGSRGKPSYPEGMVSVKLVALAVVVNGLCALAVLFIGKKELVEQKDVLGTMFGMNTILPVIDDEETWKEELSWDDYEDDEWGEHES
eukprot:TRINITY_DN61119_c0_g1_i1.p1 TRINITY_DN61119_c0_g1~~TRINITY_DN61119_c0_g1_i1.p1  ORF type:complete len:951 (+),score=133.83 TRINITY_DN61119_c0_g1_i1:74-2926(+)